MANFTVPITAQAEDIDELGHVNNAVWVRWVQEVATAHWRAVADPEHVARYVWVLTRHEIDYSANVAAGEGVTARTWISEPPRGARFDRNVEFTNSLGKICVRSKTTWALIDKATGRITRVPAEVAQAFFD